MNPKKKLAGKVLNISPKKIRFTSEAIEEIQKAITRSDIRKLVAEGKIFVSRGSRHSRAGARELASQKRKGRRGSRGSKKGSKYSLVTRKGQWISRVRVQREFIKELRDKKIISTSDYRGLYNKIKGGFFRNKRHIKLYLSELIKNAGEKSSIPEKKKEKSD